MGDAQLRAQTPAAAEARSHRQPRVALLAHRVRPLCEHREPFDRLALLVGREPGHPLPNRGVFEEHDRGSGRRCLQSQCHDELGMRLIGEMFDTSLGYRWGTPEYYRLLECAIDLRMVPLIHCENEVATEIGERYPEGQFLIMHLWSGKARDHRPKLAAVAPYPNLSLVISGTGIAVAGAIKEAVCTLGAERVVFGTDVLVGGSGGRRDVRAPFGHQ